MADLVAMVAVLAIFYIVVAWFCSWVVRLLHFEGEIRTRKGEARWLLLTIVWPIIPIIGIFWIIAVIVYWIWESLANLLHDAQLGKRN